MKAIVIICLSLAIASCKFNTKSGLKHKLGQVQRSTGKLTCKQEQVPVEYSKTYNYSRAILEKIIDSNKDLIKGEYANADNYCLQIIGSNTLNAMADYTGMIYVYFGIFSLAANDAHFASVMAHEIAHVLNDHSFISTEHRDIDKSKMTPSDQISYDKLISAAKEIDTNLHRYLVKNNEKFEKYTTEIRKSQVKVSEDHSRSKFFYYNNLIIRIVDQISILNASEKTSTIKNGDELFYAVRQKNIILGLEAIQAELITAREALMSSMTPYSMAALIEAEREYYKSTYKHQENIYRRSVTQYSIYDIISKYLGHEVAANWTEQEADEVGFELYTKAGFAIAPIKETFEHMKRAQANQNLTQMKHEDKLLEEICKRGASSHPAVCWRIKNFDKEYLDHKDQYDKNTKNIYNILTSETNNLQLVKEEIQDHFDSIAANQIDMNPSADEKVVTKNCSDYDGGFGSSFEYYGQICRKINKDWNRNGAPEYYCRVNIR